MSAGRTGKSHVAIWVLSIIAVPALYLLTYPILVSVTRKADTPWMEHYMKPYKWLVNNTPLRSPLRAYDDWWISVLERP